MPPVNNNPPLDYSRATPPLPVRASTIGMVLFLVSLGMLFFASLLGYILIRTGSPRSPGLGVLHIPAGLWLSTLIVMAGSFTVHRAVREVRREHQAALQSWLLITLLIAAAFVLTQCFFLRGLLEAHAAARNQNIQLYGLIFFLILLHGLHVLGGIIALGLVYAGARAGKYDHERYTGVRHAAFYWHFLDGVWLVMFSLLLALR